MTSRTLRGLLTASVAGLLLAVAPAVAASAATATLTASPDSNLSDGQTITVTGADYPANASVDLVQCEQGKGCDLSNNVLSRTDATGGYTASFTVHRIITVQGQQLDCVAQQDCVLVSVDYVNYAAAAQTPITFDPNAPFTPPLHFRVVPDATACVNVDKGVVRVTGRVDCNQPVDISGQFTLTQQYKRHLFSSNAFPAISCTRSGRFSVVFRPFDGLFGVGPAKLRIFAFGSTVSSSYQQNKHLLLDLVPAS